jgi:hypothetical protein
MQGGPRMTPERKPAPLDDRTIVAVEDQGKLIDLGNTKVLLDSFFDRGIHNLLVTPQDGDLFETNASHWWMLRMKSGLRLAYIGTPDSFGRLTRYCTSEGAGPVDGQAHLFEFGRNGRLQ